MTQPKCPACNRELEILYFMGIDPEYVVCVPCRLSWLCDRTTKLPVFGAAGPTVIA